MVLGKPSVPGRPTIWVIVGQRPTALAVRAGGGVWTFLFFPYLFSPFSSSLWGAARQTEILSQMVVKQKKQPINQQQQKCILASEGSKIRETG